MKDKYVFPRVEGQAPGLELRDLFAAFAVAGLLAHPACGGVGPFEPDRTLCVAREAYAVADAMLKAREE